MTGTVTGTGAREATTRTALYLSYTRTFQSITGAGIVATGTWYLVGVLVPSVIRYTVDMVPVKNCLRPLYYPVFGLKLEKCSADPI